MLEKNHLCLILCKTIWVRFKSIYIYNTFVKHDTILFRFFFGFEFFCLDISTDFMRIIHGYDSWFFERRCYFLYDVVFENIKVQLILTREFTGEFTE